jgi:hypothetical protein
MGLAGFTLADRLGAKSSPCSVPGCSRTWISLATAKGAKLGGRGAANPDDPASSMCDPCREAFAKAADVERACDRPGCDGTWTWTVAAQMQAFASKRPAPHGLCAPCEGKLEALADKPIPCAVPGCSRGSVFTRRAQLIAGAPEVEPETPVARCAQCEGVYRKLKDRPVRCGINGCDKKWTWTVDEQIQAYASGLSNDPPRRMCDTCKGDFGSIADRQVRCRTSGCKNTWVWGRSDQLDACLAGKPHPKAPHRMCDRCIGIYQGLKDVERPCRRSGCKGTWLDKRGGQLARAVRGKTGDPYPQYCENCAKEIGDLEDRQVPCKTDNCTGTWVWAKAAQLAAGVRPELKTDAAETAAAETAAAEGAEGASADAAAPNVPEGASSPGGDVRANAGAKPAGKRARKKKRRREIRPPERRCQTCIDFLKDRKTVEIPCKQCGTAIYWPPESQLQTHLGAWAEPSLCGACKRDVTEAARAAQREALRHGGAAAQIVGATVDASAAEAGAPNGDDGGDPPAAVATAPVEPPPAEPTSEAPTSEAPTS